MNNIPTFEEAQIFTGLQADRGDDSGKYEGDDFDANKPEEAGSSASDFIHDRVDPDLEDQELMYQRYQDVKKTGKCFKCGKKGVETMEVGVSSPDDFDITGVRANCKKCGWKLELDW